MKLSNCHTERTKNYCVSAFYSGETLLKQMSESRDESFVCFASHAHTKLFSSLFTSRPFCYFHLKFNRFIFFSVPFLIANKINIFIFAYTLKHVSVFFFFFLRNGEYRASVVYTTYIRHTTSESHRYAAEIGEAVFILRFNFHTNTITRNHFIFSQFFCVLHTAYAIYET